MKTNMPKKLVVIFISAAAVAGISIGVALADNLAAYPDISAGKKAASSDPVEQARILFANSQKPERKGFAAFDDLRKMFGILNGVARQRHLEQGKAYALIGIDEKNFHDRIQEQGKWAAAQITSHYKDPKNWEEADAQDKIKYPPRLLESVGLDPRSPESWKGTGLTYEDYAEVRKSFYIHYAKLSYQAAVESAASGQDDELLVMNVGDLLFKAGFEPIEKDGHVIANEEGYKAIGTTSAEFHALEKRHEILCARRLWRQMIDEKLTGSDALSSLQGVESSLQSAGFDISKTEGFEQAGISIDEFRSARRQHALEKIVTQWQEYNNYKDTGIDADEVREWMLQQIPPMIGEYFDAGQHAGVYSRINMTEQSYKDLQATVHARIEKSREDSRMNQPSTAPQPR